MPPSFRVPFLSLRPGDDRPAIDAAIARVLDRGWFILGPELQAFEQELAAASGTADAVGVGTGTDALSLILRGLGIGPGDEVITTPLSAAYSALAIMAAEARPVFADIDPARLTLDPRAIEAAITPRTAAIMPVHLYGQPADMSAILAIAERHGLAVVEDACQAHLATCDGPAGRIDGRRRRAQLLPDQEPRRARRRRRGADQRSRARRPHPPAPQRRPVVALSPRRVRRELAAGRDAGGHPAGAADPPAGLDDAAPRAGRPLSRRADRDRRRRDRRRPDAASSRPSTTPATSTTCSRCSAASATPSRRASKQTGIETLIHYPVPIPRQPAVATEEPADCPVANRICNELLSLPLYPDMADAAVDDVLAMLARVVNAG